MRSQKVFLITGCSSGFGKALVQGALDTGHKVVAASRCPDILRFDGANKNNYIPVALDLGSSASVKAAFDKSARKFGRVDVVINNAGYGLAGAFEELTDDDVQSVMDVNFMGVVRVTRQAIQTMRDINNPPGGLIQQITSIGGQAGMAVVSAYCASKWAVEGLTESIAKEMRPEWNIKLMCIEPGGFRTEWAKKNMVFRDPRQAIPAYNHLDAEKIMAGASRAQMGDPVKGAAAILQLAAVRNPPLRVPLGSEAFGIMEAKWKHGLETYREFENIALPVDLDAGEEYGRVLSQL
ncbi:putative short-chain dehydrogenase reductase sdr [Diaporthe ampelina]|uniref:Putative short-chain dehydrogenase reductase sdr n=1 Tax=Diaporthe ampelina TaxID=1214573 RepID=A0A0G2G0U7_9PEZI|nr:putative short-chain dehydrogenase reductase sdr [Diaporthe ampelina]